MPAHKACNIIERINKFILMERPLRPPEMARMLRISERHLYNYIRFMKKFGAPIYFNRSIGRYAYKESGTFFVGFLKDESDTGYDY